MPERLCEIRKVFPRGFIGEVGVLENFMWLCFVLLSASPIYANQFAGYQFQEGEPLAYKMDVDVTTETSVDKQWVDRSDKTSYKKEINMGVDCRLMPISQSKDGTWKIRLVLDKTEQQNRTGGNIKKISFDRKALTRLFNGSKIANIDFSTSMDEFFNQHDKKTESNDVQKPQPPSKSSPEELFDVPILIYITSYGGLNKFEDRAELQQVLPNLNLKDCMNLMLPSLPESGLQMNATWEVNTPVELPENPLGGYYAEPMSFTLHHAVKSVENINKQIYAKIGVSGFFKKEGLSIPIHQEEYKHLIWTTFISRLEEKIDGEYLFDLQRNIIHEVNIHSTFVVATYAWRKEDQHRSRTLTENTVHTHFISKCVPSSQPLANTAKNNAASFRATKKIDP